MAQVIIFDLDDSMDITIVNEKGRINLNVNDIFDEIKESNSTYTHLGMFETVFNYCKENNFNNKDSCLYILNSNLCLSKKIPPSTVEYISIHYNKYQITNWEIPSSKELDKIFENISDNSFKIKITYECKTRIDIFTACLFHFVSRGHILKVCPHCKKWFLTKSRNDQVYCDRNSPQYPNMNCVRAIKHIRQLSSNTEVDKKIKSVRQMIYNKGNDTKPFNEECKKWKAKIRSGKATEQEFITHLHTKYYKKKYKGGTE